MNIFCSQHLKYLNKFTLLNTTIFVNLYTLPSPSIIFINSVISNSNTERSVSFAKVLWLIEHMGIQKSFVKNYKVVRVGRNDRRVIFSSQTSNTSLKMMNFIYFFHFFVVSNMARKLIRLPNHLNSGGEYFFIIPDINVFPGYLNNFFKWQYGLFFRVRLFSRKRKELSLINNKYSLQEFGFVLI